MRDTDESDIGALGKKIEAPAPLPVPPRRFNTDGTIMQRSDGKLETNIPTPPHPTWGFYGIKSSNPVYDFGIVP